MWIALLIAMAWAAPPPPAKGEYGCLQTSLTVAMPLPGLPPSTTVTSAPAPFGNLVIDGAGGYRMTVGRNPGGSYRMDPGGKVTFTGVLGSLANTYGSNGQSLSFSFRGDGISFSCSLRTNSAASGPSEGGGSAPNGPFRGRLFFATTGGVFAIDLATGKQKPLGFSDNFDIREDGEVVYINSRGEMLLTTLDGRNSRQVSIYGAKNFSPRFSPDGGRIAYYGSQKPQGLEAALAGAFSNANLEPLIVDRNGVLQGAFGTAYAQPSWSPDGRIVVAGSKQVGSAAPNAGTGIFLSDGNLKKLRRIDANFDAPHSPAISPDGKLVVFANAAHLWICGLDGSGLKKIYDGGSKYVKYPAWSPDGKAVAFTDNGVVGIVSLDGQELAVKNADGSIARSISEVVWLR